MKDFFKKNRGKKGFVMMEVLAITVVILIIFTTVFTMFMPTEGEYEQRIDYNHVSAQYAAFYMRKIYIDEEIDYDGNTFDNNASYITLYDGENCANLDEDKKEYCESLAQELDLKEVVLTTYNISKLKEDYAGTELRDYIDYLPNYDNYPYEKDEVYRLIVKTGDDHYASMPLYTEYQDRTITIKQNPGGSLTVYNESKNTSSTSSLIAQAEDIIRGEATTNPGWTFQHISYDGDKTLENHGRFIMEDKDTTIEGIWIQNNYDITIDKNEGGNVSIFNETQNKANATDAHYQDSLEIRIDVLDGYELESVSVKTASGDNVTLNDYKFTMPLEDVTVTVRFVAKYYDLIVDPTPGSWRGTNTTTTIHKQYKTTETIENPTVPSYTINFNANLSGANLNKTSATYSKAFDKWLVEGPGTLNGTTYTFGAGNGRLTAQYKDGNAIALATASRTGYTFLGWYTSATGGTKVGSGENYVPSNITGNITLYGHWEINEYTLTVNPNGGRWNNTTATSSFTQNYGTTKEIANPTAPSYTITFNANLSGANLNKTTATYTKAFDRWNLSGSGSLSGTTYTFGAGNGTLTAQYKNGNAITLATASRTGYTFLGWYTAASGGTKVGDSGGSYLPTNITGNMTLYGHWQINSYTVTYDYTHNTFSTDTITNRGITSKVYQYNSAVDLTPKATRTSTRQGDVSGTVTWEWVGWNTDPNATTALTSYTMPANNVTLYAIYRIRPTYIARFDKTVNEYTNIDSCMRTYNDLEKCLTEGIAHNDFQNVSCTINSYAYNTQWTPGSSFNSQTCTVTSPTIEQDLVEIAGESEIITSIYYGASDYSQSQAFSATGHNHYKFRKTKYGTSYYVFNGWNTNKNAVSGVTGNITISGDDLYYPTTSHNTFKIYLLDPYYTGLQEYYEPEHYNKSWGDPQNLHNMALKKIEGPDGTNYIPLNSNGYITSVNGGNGFTNVRCNQNSINPKQMDCSSGTCVYENMNYKLWKWDELTIYGWSDVGASVGGSYIDVNSNAVIARMKLRPIGTESTSTTCGYASNSEEFVFVQAFYVTEDDINSVYPDPHTGKTSYQCYCEGSIHTFNF